MSTTKAQHVVRRLLIPGRRYQASIAADRGVLLGFIFLFMTPGTCRADMATALSQIGLLYLFFIVPIEALVFCNYPNLRNILSNPAKSFKKIDDIEILTIVLVANLASSAAGSFFWIYKYQMENLITISIAFVLSIIIEWLVYIIYFLIQRRKKVFELLNICIIGNLATYLMFFLPSATINLLSSFDYDNSARAAASNVLDAVSYYYSIPDNPDIKFDLATLRRYGYKELEHETFGIKTKMKVEIKVLEDSPNLRIATWHKKGRRVFLIDKNWDIIEKLRTELDDDLKAELGLREY